MLTITADTIQYGRDADGGGCHDLLGTRCDPYVHKLLNGEEFDLCCHSNLVRAVRPYHLAERDVHDVLNVFQVTGLTAEGRYFVKPSPARRGDFLECFAEIDVLCAISVCPHGDLSVPVWGPDAGDAISRPAGRSGSRSGSRRRPCCATGARPPSPTIAAATACAAPRTASMADSLVTIPARRGIAARVRAGQHVRIVNTHGDPGGGRLGV